MIKYLVIDVDGTLTDGGVYYDEHNNEIKKFCTKDGTGIVCAQVAGISIIVLTGRECAATKRRFTELGVSMMQQGIRDKAKWLDDWAEEKGVDKRFVGYIGDDLNDIEPMKKCGFGGCPADAVGEVKAVADYISPIKGGAGAVRDIIEWYLKKEGLWAETVEKAYGAGV